LCDLVFTELNNLSNIKTTTKQQATICMAGKKTRRKKNDTNIGCKLNNFQNAILNWRLFKTKK
jgi:hypothetical protein